MTQKENKYKKAAFWMRWWGGGWEFTSDKQALFELASSHLTPNAPVSTKTNTSLPPVVALTHASVLGPDSTY